MITPKKAIPHLLGAAIALTGCGEDAPPGRRSAFARATEAFCLRFEECDPERTALACYIYPYADFAVQYLTPDCDVLFAGLWTCLSALPCEAFVGEGYADAYNTCAESALPDENELTYCLALLP